MEGLKTFEPGFDFLAKTFAGLEEVLAAELKSIGARDVEIIKRGATFKGDDELMYKANYLCRTAIRILKPIGVFSAKSNDELYKKVRQIDWTKIFRVDQTFIVNSNVFYSEVDHSHFASLRVKDAIVDQFREKEGKRPWVAKDIPDVYVDTHIAHDICTISLDSSGESLHKREYKIAADKAPINEVLAAGMIKISGWDGKEDFYDPMCGSGTIPMEAAMIAMNIPAGYYRTEYAFKNWTSYNEDLWNKVKTEADAEVIETDCNIFASDRSETAVAITKRNLKNAGLHKDVEVSHKYFDDVKPTAESGILIFNPPYGKRLEERGELRDIYKGIGDVLKSNFTGFKAWIISPNIEAAKFVGLRHSEKHGLYNGPIETSYLKFELYSGSKKSKYQDDNNSSDKRYSSGRREGSSDSRFKKEGYGDRKREGRFDDNKRSGFGDRRRDGQSDDNKRGGFGDRRRDGQSDDNKRGGFGDKRRDGQSDDNKRSGFGDKRREGRFGDDKRDNKFGSKRFDGDKKREDSDSDKKRSSYGRRDDDNTRDSKPKSNRNDDISKRRPRRPRKPKE